MAVDGTLPDGFVESISPAHGSTNVPLSQNTVTVRFNQAMKNSGGVGTITGADIVRLRNVTQNSFVPVSSRIYDPLTYTLTLQIDSASPQWTADSLFEVSIVSTVRNVCEAAQGSNVTSQFTTAP